MKLRDLLNVCHGKVTITVMGCYSDGTYYSFMTYTDHPTDVKSIDHDSWIMDLEVISIDHDAEKFYIDVKSIVGDRPEDGDD